MRSAQIKHILETKGLYHALERVGQIGYRFARGRSRFKAMLKSLEREFVPTGARMTFCVTASLLERDAPLIQALADQGHEVAAHGHFHGRMDYFSYERQHQELVNARECFRQHGFSVQGFRCPYLNYNADTLLALSRTAYQWTSQRLVYWENGISPAMRRLDSVYSFMPARETLSLPALESGQVDIPITVPDDEMLVERLRVRKPSAIARVWRDLLRRMVEEGELLHLLYHPERFSYVRRPLLEVQAAASEPGAGVWRATLGEIADWWRRRAGARLALSTAGDGRYRIKGELPVGATLLIGRPGSSSPDSPCPGCEAVATVTGPSGTIDCEVASDRRPSIGLSAESPDSLREFLESQGYLVERSDDASRHAVQLDAKSFDGRDARPLLETLGQASHPLLRLWRWPHGNRAALAVSCDVDSITLYDFFERFMKF